MKHTPTPWAHQGNIIWSPLPSGCTIAEFNCGSVTTNGSERTAMAMEQGAANAAFAAKAVNCHDELTTALTNL